MSFRFRNLFWEAHTFPGSPQKYQRILKKINGLVAISHGLKKSFQTVGMAEEKILVAPDAVDLARFAISESLQECRKKLGLPQDKKIVLYTGHLYGWKGVDTLIQASKLFNEDTLVYLVGGTEEDVASYKPSSRAQVEGLKAESYKLVTFVGHKPHKEIPFWLKAADVLVLPNSAKEKISAVYTSPLKLFEYMAAGKPIVASDLPALREILNENAAVLVEPDNPEALAKGIEKVLKDSVLAKKIAQNAAEEAKNCTWGPKHLDLSFE
ncbi:MAG: Glycosyl transferase group 1 [Candidatus Azambacteria bacterium GW2011_GWF2_46_32]|uniref:Glycosyl transferase group 1 n=1 Tax=Candidatus Azambacteria bacterium GW2011_GWF2_46_32 TaxID=1618628 RepID=A0A0G1S2X8_9BACT|nr:MAG: Glycosyl transferase group 1 [Candidatus Azambacteria bacterium GW2011_GWF2_46_32]